MTVAPAAVDTRQRILEATATCIAEDGVAAVRMAGIARAAGVSTALLHYHFETKEQLFEQVLRHSYDSSTLLDQESLRREGLTPAQRLAAYLDRCLPSDELLARDLLLWQEFGAMSPRNPSMASVTSDFFQGDVDRVTGIVEEGVADGSFRTDDPVLVARTVIALCDGLCTRVLAGDHRVPLSEARRVVATTGSALLGLHDPLPLGTRSRTPSLPIQSRRTRSASRTSRS
ncbi:MAG: TetR/AcrR family transcriptional regulator [Candidatus Nanopelagicales bacterium]